MGSVNAGGIVGELDVAKDQARRVLYITYNKRSEGDSREQYYTEKRNNYPPDIERDPDKDYSFKV